MSHQIILTPESGGVRIQAMFELGVDGKVEVSVIIPNADLSMSVIEMQAIACEHIVEALSHRAASLRRQLPQVR
jgi:hypothetical protein